MSKKFKYGIAEVRFKKKGGTTKDKVGYIEKGSWDWGGSKPESVDVEAEQVPDAPVLTLLQSNGKISPTFNLIQLDYENLQRSQGGTLIESGSGQDKKIIGWNAPTSLVNLSGEWEIEFASGQTMTIPNATILANLGGKLTLNEASKIECQLKINKPEEDGVPPYKIQDTDSMPAGTASQSAAPAKSNSPSAG